jgi:hypothetical protein
VDGDNSTMGSLTICSHCRVLLKGIYSSKHRRKEMDTKFWNENLQEGRLTHSLNDIIPNLTQEWRMWIGFMSFRIPRYKN